VLRSRRGTSKTWAISSRVRRLGILRPDSMKLMCRWDTPVSMDKSNWFLPRTFRQWRNKFPNALPAGARAVFLELMGKLDSNLRLISAYRRITTSQVLNTMGALWHFAPRSATDNYGIPLPTVARSHFGLNSRLCDYPRQAYSSRNPSSNNRGTRAGSNRRVGPAITRQVINKGSFEESR
jgi:hypothetical protein